MIRTMKLFSCALLFTVAVNGQGSSLAAAQASDVRPEGERTSPLIMLVSFLIPGDAQSGQQDDQRASAQPVASNDAPLVSAITPMTSITIDLPQSQTGDAEAAKENETEKGKVDADIEQEKARLEQLLQQLTAKEKELALLREKTTAAATQLHAEKNRAEALEAQLNQKEQELAGICTARDNHQQMSQELNRTKSSLELAKQQVADIERGGYVLSDPLEAKFDAILIATGSEVELARQAAIALAAKGVKARVVSMPCTEAFDRQPLEWREGVLPGWCRKRVAIEAGVSDYWRKYVGLDGAVIGIDSFGASAPAEVLFPYFGFTVDKVVEAVQALG